ncbi:3-keto-5-aminohexanoate cleavage protein [Mesorhizobium sp. M0923]|uniref:3-keto-5-aminohexanoate cleavage protein n=1 Tax=Mesorhizobium sp. M0923 TaxID=2957028 RepID=UPI0033369475
MVSFHGTRFRSFLCSDVTPRREIGSADLLPFLEESKPRFAHWSVCAFGAREAACVTAAALLGGHVRVGFENNRQLAKGALADSRRLGRRCIKKPLGTWPP